MGRGSFSFAKYVVIISSCSCKDFANSDRSAMVHKDSRDGRERESWSVNEDIHGLAERCRFWTGVSIRSQWETYLAEKELPHTRNKRHFLGPSTVISKC